ncbi:MAG: hypothetical protein DRQ88_12445 [Epsilonproteobacteria bacterium]|nr:MAG: hypothetical protein DRQ88_12445 [Campylobacterota bacterium]
MKSNTAVGEPSVDRLLKKRKHFLPIDEILKEKAPNHTEIEVCFFHTCNINCKFCWQSSSDERGEDTIVEKADIVLEYAQKSPVNSFIQIHLLGGEIFDDGKNRYNDYKAFLSKIHENLKTKHKFIFLTNMNWSTDSTDSEVESLIAYMESMGIDFHFTTSWDPTGRPIKGEVETDFHKNLMKYKKYVSEITFVLTKPTIQKLLGRDTSYLDLLITEGFQVDIDYYMPTSSTDQLMPTDRMLLEAMLCLNKHYPKIKKMSNLEGKITCMSPSKVTIMPDGTLTCCMHIEYDQKEFNTPIVKESNSPLILNFLEKNGCFSCEYYSKCPFTCFVMDDHKSFKRELNDCLYKLYFDKTKITS